MLTESNCSFLFIFFKNEVPGYFLFFKKKMGFYLCVCEMLNIFPFFFKILTGIMTLFIGLIPWGKFRPGH